MTGTIYPKSTDYQLAVQNPHVVFRDPELAASNVEKTPLGQPVLRGGSFAVTFHLTHEGQDWGVRCFKQELGDLERRYMKISDALRRAALPCFAHFEYQPEGILVDGSRFPIVKMAWIPGVTLGSYVERYYRDAARIRALATNFREMVKILDGAKIAHGDLQHANIMASDTGITLIDYDGMYVPGIGLTYSNEVGHVDYQSPLRTGSDYNSVIDRFSSIVITLALRALERDPDLWERYSENGDRLLFGRKDFLDPQASPLMQNLIAMPDIKVEAEQLQRLCRTPLDHMPTLEAFLAGAKVSADTAVVTPLMAVRLRQYDVLYATEREAILTRVGDRIEVVGQIIDVKEGYTRYGKPYAFLNFGDWRTGAFQIVLWPESLQRFTQHGQNVRSYLGRWVSIIGLVEEYRRGRHSPQIVVNDRNNLRMLDGEAEAKQIHTEGQGASPFVSPRGSSVARQQPTAGTRSRNDEIRTALRQTTKGASAASPHTAMSSPPPPSVQPMNAATARTNDTVRRNLQSLSRPSPPAFSQPRSPTPAPSKHAASQKVVPKSTPQSAPQAPRGAPSQKWIVLLVFVSVALLWAVILLINAATP